MGSRAWGAVRRFEEDIDTYVEESNRLPRVIYDRAQELGWDEIWQLTYCQWCANYAHESDPSMTDQYWDDPDLDDLRGIWGPSARSIFSIVDKDEAAWVIDADFLYPVIGLYEERLIGYWDMPYSAPDGFVTISVPRWGLPSEGYAGIPRNSTMPESEMKRIDAFWRADEGLFEKQLMKLNNAAIQIPFLTRGAFAKFRDAIWAEEVNSDGETIPGQLRTRIRQIQYDGPLYQWWYDIIVRNDYQWPTDVRSSYAAAYAEQVEEISTVLSEIHYEIFGDELPISPSSPIQPESLQSPTPDLIRAIINRRSYALDGSIADAVFDELVPLLQGRSTLEVGDDGEAVFGR